MIPDPVAAAVAVVAGNKLFPVVLTEPAVVVAPFPPPRSKGPVVVATEPDTPRVPVQDAPLGQQATMFAASGVQMAFVLQHAEPAPRLVQALYPA